MTITFLDGSWQDSIEERVTNNGGGGGLPGRLNSLESWRSNKSTHIGADLSETTPTALDDGLNTVSTLLGAAVGAINDTRTRVNQNSSELTTVKQRVNDISAILVEREIMEAA